MKLESGVDMKLAMTEHGPSIVAGKVTYPIGVKGLVKLLMVFRGMSENEDLNTRAVLEHMYDEKDSSYYRIRTELGVYSIKQWEAFAFMIAAEQLLGEVVLCS